MPFDPDAYLKKAAEFNPDSYLDKKNNPVPKTSGGTSLLRGAAQGASFGFADEIAGGLGAASDYIAGNDGTFTDQYAKNRDESRAAYDKAQKDNPGLYTTGEVGGAVGSAFLPGLGWANAAKGATVAGRIGTAALAGGLSGAGMSTATPTNSPESLKQFVTDTATGAATGAAFQGTGDAVGKAASKMGKGLTKGLDSFADWNTLKASGAMTKDRKAMRHQGVSKDVADYLRRKGVVSFGSTVDDAVERSKPLVSEAKETIGDALMMLDDHVGAMNKLDPVAVEMANPAMSVNSSGQSFPTASGEASKLNRPPPKGFNPSEVADKIEQELIAPMKDGPRAAKQIAEKLQEEVDDLRARGDTMSFVDANKLKNKYYDIIGDYGREKSPYIEGLKKYGGIFNKSMEEAADKVAQQADNPGLFTVWKQAKKDFGHAKTSSEMSANRADQIRTNNPFGLTDYLAGGGAIAGGLANDDPSTAAMAIPLMVGNRLARSRGPAALAIGSKSLSSFMKAPPAGLERFSKVLTNAAKRGNNSLAATHLFLMQNEPDYQKAMGEK